MVYVYHMRLYAQVERYSICTREISKHITNTLMSIWLEMRAKSSLNVHVAFTITA